VQLFRKYLLEKEVDTEFENVDKQALDQALVNCRLKLGQKTEACTKNLVQVFYDIKWISSGAFESIQVHQEKTWYFKCNKTITALHFVQWDVQWSIEKQ